MSKDNKLNQKDAAKVSDELDQLAKSGDDVIEDGISELEKAIIDMEDVETLEKSDDDDSKQDDLEKSGDDDGADDGADDGGGDDSGDDDGADADLEKSGDDDGADDGADADLEKSGDDAEDKEFDFGEFGDELEKASVAYAALEETVKDGILKSETVLEGQGDIAAALGTLTDLTVKIGKGLIVLHKSVAEMAKHPASASIAVLATDKADDDADMVKSIATVRMTLTELCQKEEDPADPRLLGVLATQGIEGLKKALESQDETELIKKLSL